MFSAFCKCNDGQSFPTKYTSVGRLQRQRKEGEGHWLVAHRKAEQQRNRKVLRRIKEAYRNEKNPHGATLDAEFLLRLHCVAEPSQLCSVDISEQKLNSVNPEDLKLFTNVAYVDASINSLTLEPFCFFTSLRELCLALNGICDMTFDAAAFPHLKVLDLSFNRVSAQGLVSISRLPRLKTLHLTGNQLHCLPPAFGSSDHDQAQLPAEEGAKQFEALEVLMLDNNKLSSKVFYSLTNLTKLKFLNLQGNQISAIPLLKVGGSSKAEQLSVEAQFQSDIDEYLKIMETFQMEKGCSLPLPELLHLNLSENKISTEEKLIGAALFPKLSELVIHSNPLITQKRGLSVLNYYLQERRGITIQRNKEQKVKKLPLKVSVDSRWKVEENFRKVSKRPCLTDPVCLKQTDKNEEKIQETTQSEDKNTTNFQKDTKHFLITQAEDELEFELVSSSEKKETTENKQRKGTSPKESTSNKMIQNPEVNPDVLKHARIQTAAQMLEHRLRNLNVYRDSKPKLDSIQTPYRPRGKKIKELPPVGPKKRSSQRVDEMMEEMKASTTITVAALGGATGSKGASRKDYKEARSLLKDLMVKHKTLFEKTWEPTEPMLSPLQRLGGICRTYFCLCCDSDGSEQLQNFVHHVRT